VSPQAPPAQDGAALAPPSHRRPQAPQCCASDSSRAQRSTQKVAPPEQTLAQAPAEQAVPASQRCPHAPQLALSPLRSASQPLVGLPSQSAKPASQLATAQRPALHEALAWGTAQRSPHPPQCAALDATKTSQPLRASPSQSLKPASQVTPHMAIAQVATALGPAGQARPQAPQCATLRASSVSQPLAAAPSQSP
jgi:hypothetical protein